MVGLFDSIKLVGVLILAIPAALAGLEFLLVRGEPVIGAALLVLATALVVGQHYLSLPTSVRGLLLNGVLGSGSADSESESRDD
ncbi:DUF7533 family protein [Natronobeatus ordinarius]|uniref:DUF7533 family protein n=1 Tax=Natronobeatus ordinarius TaxID=2963433 RepID=UPI0020CC0141|nr:hypothetical protein [Natronobeatus ordinarius]